MPTQAPTAPAASTAASPRPLAIPPAATTGRSVSSSTICSSGSVPTAPVWPPRLGALRDERCRRRPRSRPRPSAGSAPARRRGCRRRGGGRRAAPASPNEMLISVGLAAIAMSSSSGRWSITHATSPIPNGTGVPARDDRQLGGDALLGVGLLDPDHAERAGLADGAREPAACLGRHRRADQRHLDAEQLGQPGGDHALASSPCTHIFTLDTPLR